MNRKDAGEEPLTLKKPVVTSLVPDGGWGWVVCLSIGVINFLNDGIMISFGVFFMEFMEYFEDSKSKTALIGSVVIGVGMVIGPLISMLLQTYSCRRIMVIGSLIHTAAYITGSFATSVDFLIVAIGIIAGFGAGLVYISGNIIVCLYFTRKRALATGIAAAGSGVGQFVFAYLSEYLIERFTWRGAYLILAAILLNSIPCALLCRPIVPRDDSLPICQRLWLKCCEITSQWHECRLDFFRLYRMRSAMRPHPANVIPSHNKDIVVSRSQSGHVRHTPFHHTENDKAIQYDSHPHFETIIESQITPHVRLAHEDKYETDIDILSDIEVQEVIKQGYKNPYLRKDILYAASIEHLPEYEETHDMESFIVSMTNLSYIDTKSHVSDGHVSIVSLNKRTDTGHVKLFDVDLLKNRVFLLLLSSLTLWAVPVSGLTLDRSHKLNVGDIASNTDINAYDTNGTSVMLT